ncbi:MAG: hypothetical protein H7256_06105 [Bdellovibrio sp.]|nr:hypothetical protein [Bdellovibrio sp.]
MAYILYDQGKKLGEIENWQVTAYVPSYKNVLGKMVLAVAQKDECSFVSPKPVNRRSELTVIENGQLEFILQVKSVKGTSVIAAISSQKELSKN